MKLRNKRTGEIYEPTSLIEFTYEDDSDYWAAQYDSLAKLNEEWEDYKPAEPLIKDEKIRKAVRAWAEANDIRYARRCGSTSPYAKRIVGYNAVGISFTTEFDKELKIYGDSITKDSYTIEELCGEEEE